MSIPKCYGTVSERAPSCYEYSYLSHFLVHGDSLLSPHCSLPACEIHTLNIIGPTPYKRVVWLSFRSHKTTYQKVLAGTKQERLAQISLAGQIQSTLFRKSAGNGPKSELLGLENRPTWNRTRLRRPKSAAQSPKNRLAGTKTSASAPRPDRCSGGPNPAREFKSRPVRAEE